MNALVEMARKTKMELKEVEPEITHFTLTLNARELITLYDALALSRANERVDYNLSEGFRTPDLGTESLQLFHELKTKVREYEL